MDSTRAPLRESDQRAAAVVGRHARLELAFACRGGRTVLTHAYAEPPLRIGRAFDVNGAAYVILVCTGPGIFAGDRLYQHVSVGSGARVMLASQSALQIHPPGDDVHDVNDVNNVAARPATTYAVYDVAEGGELHCHWDPVIPFAGARLVQRADLRVAPSSRLYWSDSLMAGRVGRGEAWQFDSVDHELRLAVGDRLSYLERYRLVPSDRSVTHPWRAGAAECAGTLLVHHEAAVPAAAEELQRHLTAIDAVTGSIDLVEPALMVGRLLGQTGPAWSRARALCRDVVLASTFQDASLVMRR